MKPKSSWSTQLRCRLDHFFNHKSGLSDGSKNTVTQLKAFAASFVFNIKEDRKPTAASLHSEHFGSCAAETSGLEVMIAKSCMLLGGVGVGVWVQKGDHTPNQYT